jgi:hypothetical protein
VAADDHDTARPVVCHRDAVAPRVALLVSESTLLPILTRLVAGSRLAYPDR